MIKYSFESRFYQGPVVDKPVVDKPVVDKPVVDKPVVDKPVVDKPVVDTVFCGTLRSGEVVPHPMVKNRSKNTNDGPIWMPGRRFGHFQEQN